ncbi:glycoside hydrolase family 6 protein [Streptomyces sp. DSM 40750]|uniref:glycoside hydrolase family 6 protein n=1 Tax=Streptomyces sp. DSM 40750 TaxID=2801030 RepID=UPI00214ABCFF|nr:glycoside hydrolase family 6 protein [Streptomyces sp. DSM 40750]UUU24983.1 glycoside hydrolase family 6 protein [Streptomyces sp. DSM 40750]
MSRLIRTSPRTPLRTSPRKPLRVLAAFSALAALGLVLGCSSKAPSGVGEASVIGGATEKPAGEAARPVSRSPFWVDPSSPAARQVDVWERAGRKKDALLLRRIADRPTARWPAGDDPVPMIEEATKAAGRASRTAVFVAYNIPHRDCGQHSAGGAHDPAVYGEWIDAFADAIGDSDALVVLEPDAIAHIVDGCTPGEYHAERERLLGEAIDRFKRQPNTKVYLDAGNPAWIDDPGRLVDPLRRAGVARADGFSLNVSNFQTDAATTSYGLRLSDALGGKHFVVDTSRNGNGPLNGDRGTAWCNPPGRALGTPPTTDTGEPALDAYLWIKRPGESDGECRGGPAAGQWWPDYALGLARNSKA